MGTGGGGSGRDECSRLTRPITHPVSRCRIVDERGRLRAWLRLGKPPFRNCVRSSRGNARRRPRSNRCRPGASLPLPSPLSSLIEGLPCRLACLGKLVCGLADSIQAALPSFTPSLQQHRGRVGLARPHRGLTGGSSRVRRTSCPPLVKLLSLPDKLCSSHD